MVFRKYDSFFMYILIRLKENYLLEISIPPSITGQWELGQGIEWACVVGLLKPPRVYGYHTPRKPLMTSIFWWLHFHIFPSNMYYCIKLVSVLNYWINIGLCSQNNMLQVMVCYFKIRFKRLLLPLPPLSFSLIILHWSLWRKPAIIS